MQNFADIRKYLNISATMQYKLPLTQMIPPVTQSWLTFETA
jgi:hypothetical protein